MLMNKKEKNKKNISQIICHKKIKRKELSLNAYEDHEEFDNLKDLSAWAYEKEELSEINFNTTAGIEVLDHLNLYVNKPEEEISLLAKKEEINCEEKINLSFKSNLTPICLTPPPYEEKYIEKKRNRLDSNSGAKKENINININLKSKFIFKIEKINKNKPNFLQNDFTKSKFDFFKTSKFNPFFKELNSKKKHLKKLKPIFKTLNLQQKQKVVSTTKIY